MILFISVSVVGIILRTGKFPRTASYLLSPLDENVNFH
jgi:hypothetical protein